MKNNYLKILISVVFLSILNCGYVMANVINDEHHRQMQSLDEFTSTIFMIVLFIVGLFGLIYMKNKIIKEKNEAKSLENETLEDDKQ